MKKLTIITTALLLAFIFTSCNFEGAAPNANTKNSYNVPDLSESDELSVPENTSNEVTDDSVPDQFLNNAFIKVYNISGHLINTVNRENGFDALKEMLTGAPVYSGPDMNFANAPYRLIINDETDIKYHIWLRDDRIYFKNEGSDIIYAPDNMKSYEFKRIINDK